VLQRKGDRDQRSTNVVGDLGATSRVSGRFTPQPGTIRFAAASPRSGSNS
jgi:hypothetical protein